MELLHRTFYTALSALSLFYIVIRVSLGYWKRRGILHPKPKFLWGNIKGVIGGKRHICDVLQSVYDDYKGRAPFIGCYACIKPFVFVLDLNLARHILVTNAGYFTTRGLYSNVRDEPLSGNLFQLDGHKWRHLHAQSSSIFAPANLKKMLPQLLEIATAFGRTLESKQHTMRNCNISELIDIYNIDVMSAIAFGQNGGTLEYSQSEFRNMTHSYWGNFSLCKAYMALEFPTVARLFRYKSYADAATTYFHKLVVTQLGKLRRNSERKLDNFLKLYTLIDGAEQLSDTQIAAQVFGFILAGLAPLNSTLSFCLYELALQPEIQERVRSEIRTVLQQHNGQLTVECLGKLIFTKQVLKETLRLHTPYPFLLRRATKSFEVPESVFMIARGNNVLIPTAAIHRDPHIYADPLRFDPARFELSAMRNRSDMAFLPFGDGLRGCIASQLAELHLLIGLVSLLQHYHYEPCANTIIPMQYDNEKFILLPKTDIQLDITRVSA